VYFGTLLLKTEGLNMPKKTDEVVEPFEEVLVEVRGEDGKTQKVAPAAADIMCRKGGFVNVAKEKAEKEK